ncbi:hypothetical protein F5B22DRAFT_299439 [Xylaria bambusicola]|uniref:uncharacterized protein n=1 Tax=Xylaria bambusicola TaxID=326684 RepID=UPI0020075368|nr:uncharacterized protein F5B22DRAFT_299439 [Xylaria bambusicola]KAI0512630.1 hypothetical protein F5B22DRAFT_299439 [Xylaria bambusicola]
MGMSISNDELQLERGGGLEFVASAYSKRQAVLTGRDTAIRSQSEVLRYLTVCSSFWWPLMDGVVWVIMPFFQHISAMLLLLSIYRPLYKSVPFLQRKKEKKGRTGMRCVSWLDLIVWGLGNTCALVGYNVNGLEMMSRFKQSN